MNVEIWSDIACPWCFIGKRRFEAALAQFPHRDEVTVRWRSYQLDPSLPDHYDGTELEYLVQRKGMAPQQIQSMLDHVAQQAAGEGLQFDVDSLVVANSFRAHELLHLAATISRAGEVKERLLSDHFEHGRDIGDIDLLVEIGATVGLDEGEIRDALASARFADAVRADIDEGVQLGLRGVPFYVIDRAFGISGAQPVEVFANALDRAWRESHPLQPIGADTDAGVCGPDGCSI